MISGFLAPGFELVRAEVESILADLQPDNAPFSAQLAAFVDGQAVVDLVVGDGLRADAVTGVFSVSKGVAGIVIGTLVQSGQLDLDRPVADYWPEFAEHGKGQILVRELLSHQAGLVGLQGGLSTADLVDSASAASRLACARPAWRPGAMFGYHGLTLGILMEELVRRVSGVELQHLFEHEIRAPRGLDFYLGLPPEEEYRFQPMEPPLTGVTAVAGLEPPADGLSELMFNATRPSENIVHGPASPNIRAIRVAGPAAVGGVGTARGLAQTYAAAIGPVLGEGPVLDDGTIGAMSQEQVSGTDRLLGVDMRFGVVFMKSSPRISFGSYASFGHDGAGGALGFADPLHCLAFGYIPFPMQLPGGADRKGLRLASVVRACAARQQAAS